MLMLPDPLAAAQVTQLIFNQPAPTESEDCLYLNVYAPATPAGSAGRAVMFWIYGGALQFGNAGELFSEPKSFKFDGHVLMVSQAKHTMMDLHSPLTKMLSLSRPTTGPMVSYMHNGCIAPLTFRSIRLS